jgi:uncharacterized protein (TIGR00730 family)
VAASGRALVYGGGTIGIMGTVARAVVGNGGRCIGIIPAPLAPKEVSGHGIGEVTVVDTMAERKQLMFAQSSWLICLPGGIGTLDEFFEMLTLCQLNAFKCRVGMLNTANFYGPMMAMLHHLVTQQFLEAELVDKIVVRDTPEEIFEAMGTARDIEAVGFATSLRWTNPQRRAE